VSWLGLAMDEGMLRVFYSDDPEGWLYTNYLQKCLELYPDLDVVLSEDGKPRFVPRIGPPRKRKPVSSVFRWTVTDGVHVLRRDGEFEIHAVIYPPKRWWNSWELVCSWDHIHPRKVSSLNKAKQFVEQRLLNSGKATVVFG
jgi:hypothetical protein